MSTALTIYEPDKLHLLFEDQGPRGPSSMFVTVTDVQNMVYDLGSWLRFYRMLRTGTPALMTTRIGAKIARIKVVRQGGVPHDATFDSV